MLITIYLVPNTTAKHMIKYQGKLTIFELIDNFFDYTFYQLPRMTAQGAIKPHKVPLNRRIQDQN